MKAHRTDVRKRLLAWYRTNARDLPWREPGPHGRPEPYHVLLSEFMLQQTQVKTVIAYFEAFLRRFPTVTELADASIDDVLHAWQGLGYYRRARNLHAAAQQIASEHQGAIPRDVATLRALPGIGRYTAGAIASIAFDVPAPILDGNVTRVLCRLDKLEDDPTTPSMQTRLWERAEELVDPRRPGDFNSAMMELGATVCTPRTPACLDCPLTELCLAREAGVTDRIPKPKRAIPQPMERRCVVCICDACGRWLIEQRPPTGRWAGLWQFVTFDETGAIISREVANRTGLRIGRPRKAGEVQHALTHRQYVFAVYVASLAEGCDAEQATGLASSHTKGASDINKDSTVPARAWVTLDELADYALARPQRRIASMID